MRARHASNAPEGTTPDNPGQAPPPPRGYRWSRTNTPDGYTIISLELRTLLGWRKVDHTITFYGDQQHESYRLLLRRHQSRRHRARA